METLGALIWIVIALPLAGAVVLHFVGRRLGEPLAGWFASAAIGAAFLVAAVAAVPFISGHGEAASTALWTWMPALGAEFRFRWDPLSAVMTLLVTGVGTLIHVFAIGYMHGDERFSRFFTYLNLFAASMLTLVLADNFAVLFMGWELVGLCSYLLISFWFTRPSAAAAGKKAFVVNRIGDFGFVVALMVVFFSFGTLDFGYVFEHAPDVLTVGAANAIGLLLLVGAAGKSAQLPLYVWLPDAMEGPTPVSALIHAATMVTAGVYMVARTAVIFEMAPAAAATVALVGALTALYAATIAVAQWDIKRILAYSTISQLGYMFMAVGAAAHVAGIFHLLTHGFFKALLFLAAGSVIHGMHEEQDVRRMGGLARKMPVTAATAGIATLAIAGIPPFAGFWSKDEILASVFARGGPWLVLWAIGLLTAVLTAFYMGRWFVLVFLGRPRWPEGVEPHESPRVMTWPLVGLAVLSAVGGLINTPWRLGLEHFLEPAFELVHLSHPPEEVGLLIALALVSVLAAAAGLFVAWRLFTAPEAVQARFVAALGPVWALWERAYGVDDLYGRLIVLPGKRLAQWLADVFDQRVVDGIVNGLGVAVRRVAVGARRLQPGYVRMYGASLAIGALALLAFLLGRGLS